MELPSKAAFADSSTMKIAIDNVTHRQSTKTVRSGAKNSLLNGKLDDSKGVMAGEGGVKTL